jgi:hypothetical protein
MSYSYRQLLPSDDDYSYIQFNPMLRQKVIRDVTKMYILLSRAIDALNSFFSLQVRIYCWETEFLINLKFQKILSVFLLAFFFEIGILYFILRMMMGLTQSYTSEMFVIGLIDLIEFVGTKIVCIFLVHNLVSKVIN